MISRNRAVLVGLASPSGKRLDVAADRRQRRPQLVRDVGDEVAPDLVRAPQIGDVVQDEHGAVRGRRRRAGAARAMIVRDGSRGGESCSASGVPPASAAASSSAIAGWRIVST